MRIPRLSVLALALVAAVAGAADDRCVFTLPVPDLSRAFAADAVVVAVQVRIECAGVGSVEGLPDGWSTTLVADGETTTVRVARSDAEAWLARLGAKDGAASNEQLGRIRLGVLSRGQWSDCMSEWATAEALVPGADGQRVRQRLGWYRDWDDTVKDEVWSPSEQALTR